MESTACQPASHQDYIASLKQDPIDKAVNAAFPSGELDLAKLEYCERRLRLAEVVLRLDEGMHRVEESKYRLEESKHRLEEAKQIRGAEIMLRGLDLLDLLKERKTVNEPTKLLFEEHIKKMVLSCSFQPPLVDVK